ncbi:MAG TPA: hypothetical protein VGK64_08295 [Bryobacteraceae bacterium]
MKLFSSLVSTVLIPLIAVLPIRAQLPPAPAGAEATLQVRVLESSGSRFLVEVTDGAAPVAGAAVAFRLPDSDPIGTFADGSHAAVVYTDTNGRARVDGIHWNRTSGSATVRITAAKGGAHAGLILDQAISTSVVPVPVAKTVPQPGVLKPAVQTKVVTPPASVARSGASTPAAAEPPHVSVTSASPGEAPHSSSKKWLVIALLAGAAGAGAAFAMKGKSSSPAAPAPSLSIGNPSISIGHP